MYSSHHKRILNKLQAKGTKKKKNANFSTLKISYFASFVQIFSNVMSMANNLMFLLTHYNLLVIVLSV